MTTKDKEHGEGNYKATEQYNEATKKFIDSGKVDDAARDAEPRSQQEARDMAEAEKAGKAHAKDGEGKKSQQQR